MAAAPTEEMPPDVLEDRGNYTYDQGQGEDKAGDPDLDVEIGGNAAGDTGDDAVVGVAVQPFTGVGWQRLGREHDPEDDIEEETKTPENGDQYKEEANDGGV